MLAVADTIKELLKVKKISQTELSEQLGMTKQNLSNKLNRNTFSPDELVKIAHILDMELAFVDGEEKYVIEAKAENIQD